MGPLEVDLFASHLSRQLPRFYSWRPDPEAEATDAGLHAGLVDEQRVCEPREPSVVSDTTMLHTSLGVSSPSA